ncbi:MAG: large conductance mechanosensitive channel protein MscL [Gemmatimonadales bacterium]|jgi:large conductance mechanosensitive channel|nr:MAG: large conductance mechanosensitive channel protein MscL [Gemmatimonadales bacterium]
MLEDFKKFLMRGNVVDLAVGVIIGAAFGKIIASLVDDILMPVLGLGLGRIDFSNLYLLLSPGADGLSSYPSLAAAREAGAATLNYGVFISATITFVIVAAAIFVIVRLVSRFDKKAAPPPASTKDCPQCQMTVPLGATKCGHCTSAIAA